MAKKKKDNKIRIDFSKPAPSDIIDEPEREEEYVDEIEYIHVKDYFGSMTDVSLSVVRYLVEPYIPLGCMTILDGDPGAGKSFFTMYTAACVSRGDRWCGQKLKKARNVLILAVEDDADRVLLPRLREHGADLSRIDYMVKPFLLDDIGIELIEIQIKKRKYGLIIIDPIVAFMDGGSDMHRANQVRGFLMPLAELAKQYDVGVLIVRHLRKAETDAAIHRGMGSIDFIAAVRSALILGRSPDDEDCRIVAHAKANYSKEGSALIFRFVTEGDSRYPKIIFEGSCSMSAEQLLKAQYVEDAELTKAIDFLKEILAEGAVSSSTVMTQAAARSFSNSTIKRARQKLGVKATKGKGAKMWLPE